MKESAGYGYDVLRNTLYKQTNIDLAQYKDRQMVRRLTGYLRRVNVSSFVALARLIQRDTEELNRLKQFITINVTEFFRNPDRFEELKEHVIPCLAQQHQRINVWSAGTSSGAEAYSLAILFAELNLHHRYNILATDIDSAVLEEAKQGVYDEDRMREVSVQRRERFFTALDNGLWQVQPELKRRVHFQQHDLLHDAYPQRQHLILCRNVVIYFKDEAKARIVQQFSESLVPGGYLLIGGTESLLDPTQFGLKVEGPFLYRRIKGDEHNA